MDSDIPEAIRAQARQEVARRQARKTGTADTRRAAHANRAGVALLPRLAAAFPQTFFADPKQVRPLKAFLYRDLLRLAKAGALPDGIDRAALKAFLHWYGRRTAYLVTLKFTTLPNPKPAGSGKMAFALKTPDGQFITAEVGNKVWNKLVKAAEDWPGWIAALTGTMGERTEKGFALANPGLQVFERKPKASVAAASPLADALSAALAAANPVEPAPAPAVAELAEPVSVPSTPAAAAPDPARRKAVLSLKNRP